MSGFSTKSVWRIFVLISLLVMQIAIQPVSVAQAAPPAQPVQLASRPAAVNPIPLAAGQPTVSLSVPSNVLLGSDVQFTVTFTNGGVTGYGPFIDLIIPTKGASGVYPGTPASNAYDGLGNTKINASFLGASFITSGPSQNMWVIPFDSSGHATHPLLRDSSGTYQTVSGTAGDTLVVLRLPFGSFTPSQPPAVVDVTVDMSDYANIGTALNIQARGGYQFGYTPEDDFCCGDDPTLTLSSFNSASVTPTLWTLSKTYDGPEDETA